MVLPPSILDGYAQGEVDADEIYGAMKYGLERTNGKSVLEIVPGTDFDPPLLGRVVVRWADDERYFHYRVEFVSEAGRTPADFSRTLVQSDVRKVGR